MAKSPLQLVQSPKDSPISTPAFNASKPITKDSLEDLINTFLTVPYRSEDARSREYLDRCWHFLKRDYKVGWVHNTGGVLCSHYPPIILIPEQEVAKRESENGAVISEGSDESVRKCRSLNVFERGAVSGLAEAPAELSESVRVEHDDDGEITKSFLPNIRNNTWQGDEDTFRATADKTDPMPETFLNRKRDQIKTPHKENLNDVNNLAPLFLTARFARARSRFAVPVLIYKNKNLCRSATLSVGAELLGRTGWDMIATGGEGVEEKGASNLPERSRLGREEQLCDKVRGQDIKLLKALRVRVICDLMYEQKKHKFLLPVASSEKVDKEGRYREFYVASMPYPGCESFRGFQSKELDADKIRFNWKSGKVNAMLSLPIEIMPPEFEVKWPQYQQWEIRELTANYLRYILYQLEHLDGGALVHCISGWDRTPMFISLLRLSLWADGLVHTSLDTLEMLFFTIAYDWRLFGHKLSERNAKSEEIFYFGMNFLQYMTGSEFSLHCDLKKGESKFPEQLSARKGRLDEMRTLFLESYSKILVPKSIKFSKISNMHQNL